MVFSFFSFSFGTMRKKPVVFCLELSEPSYFHFSAATVTPHTFIWKKLIQFRDHIIYKCVYIKKIFKIFIFNNRMKICSIAFFSEVKIQGTYTNKVSLQCHYKILSVWRFANDNSNNINNNI